MGESSRMQHVETARPVSADHTEPSVLLKAEVTRPNPLPEPKYQNLLDGVRVTVGEQSRDYRGGLGVVALHGKSVRIIVSLEDTDLHGAYNVRDQVINFGRSAIANLETDPDLFWSACVHELAHMRYFDLDNNAQTELNDFVVRRFCDEFREFQENLYSEEGGKRYMNAHQSGSTSRAIPFRFVGGGLRDWRVMTARKAVGSNETVDVRLGILVTEFLSHASSLYVGAGVYEKELAANRFSPDRPSFYGAVLEFKKRIDADPKLAAFVKKSGIFIDADPSVREKVLRSILAAKARSVSVSTAS